MYWLDIRLVSERSVANNNMRINYEYTCVLFRIANFILRTNIYNNILQYGLHAYNIHLQYTSF